jgi:hypothetical protein
MKEVNLLAAILTVAFYNGRGAAMGLPQIVATYDELRGLLAEEASPRAKRKRRR